MFLTVFGHAHVCGHKFKSAMHLRGRFECIRLRKLTLVGFSSTLFIFFLFVGKLQTEDTLFLPETNNGDSHDGFLVGQSPKPIALICGKVGAPRRSRAVGLSF